MGVLYDIKSNDLQKAIDVKLERERRKSLMIKFENTEVMGWEAAIRGMRNPMNSWEKSDSLFIDEDGDYYNLSGDTGPAYLDGGKHLIIGPNDIDLMRRLRNAGTDHRKFMRMITVYVDITAPLYWWKEFDTYKVGTVANSCSTMHKITEKEFTLEDFSREHLTEEFLVSLKLTIKDLNKAREAYNWCNTNAKKDWWWQMIQLLPSSYNQKRTVMLNYEVLANIYKSRKNHKLDEWARHEYLSKEDLSYENTLAKHGGFCDWIKILPYSELITGETKNE